MAKASRKEIEEVEKEMAGDLSRIYELRANIYLKILGTFASTILTLGLIFFAGIQIIINYPLTFNVIFGFYIFLGIMLILSILIPLLSVWKIEEKMTAVLKEKNDVKIERLLKKYLKQK